MSETLYEVAIMATLFVWICVVIGVGIAIIYHTAKIFEVPW